MRLTLLFLFGFFQTCVCQTRDIDKLIKKAEKETDKEAKIAYLTQIVSIDPTYRYAYFERSLIYIELKRFNEAMEDCSRLIELDPRNFTGYLNRGICKMSDGDPRDAIHDFYKVILLDPNNITGHFDRGIVKMFKLGNYDEGIVIDLHSN